MLEELLNSVEEKHRQRPITPEAYSKWRVNGVTKRLMEELELRLIDLISQDMERTVAEQKVVGGSLVVTQRLKTMDEIALAASDTQVTKQVCESVLNWKPAELEEEE